MKTKPLPIHIGIQPILIFKLKYFYGFVEARVL
jgi:hypothetical protein